MNKNNLFKQVTAKNILKLLKFLKLLNKLTKNQTIKINYIKTIKLKLIFQSINKFIKNKMNVLKI